MWLGPRVLCILCVSRNPVHNTDSPFSPSFLFCLETLRNLQQWCRPAKNMMMMLTGRRSSDWLSPPFRHSVSVLIGAARVICHQTHLLRPRPLRREGSRRSRRRWQNRRRPPMRSWGANSWTSRLSCSRSVARWGRAIRRSRCLV